MGKVKIGKITKIEKGVNRESGPVVVLLQVQLTDDGDVQTVQLMNPPGEDNMPVVGSRVVVHDVGSALKIAYAANDGLEPSMAEGEKMIYSLESGIIKGFIKLYETGNIIIEGAKVTLTASGDLELNGNVDYAVRFNALQTQLTAFMVMLLAHTHSGVASGAATSGTVNSPLTLDISTAKATTVRLP